MGCRSIGSDDGGPAVSPIFTARQSCGMVDDHATGGTEVGVTKPSWFGAIYGSPSVAAPPLPVTATFQANFGILG